MLSKQVEDVKRHWEHMAVEGAKQPPLDELRDMIEKEWAKLTGEPGGVDYVEVDAGGVPAMWIVPKKCAEDRVVLCMHGGGAISGSMYTHRKMYGHLAKAIGCRALSLNYRRAPEHKHPAQIEDTVAAYRWLLERVGVKPAQVAFAGDSSGGGLAIGGLLCARDQGLPLPAASMTMSAWLDMECSGETYRTNREKDVFFSKESVQFLQQLFLGESGDRRDPYVSSIYANLSGLPPVYLQAGADETLLDDSRVFAERAKKAGVEVRLEVFPEMLHTFQMAAGRAAEANDAIKRLAEWVRPKLGLPATGR